MLSDDFYENYGREWATPLRASHEELCSEEKLNNWSAVIPPSVTIKSLIDFGCGNGVFMNLFAERLGCHAIGIDISRSMIDISRHKFPHHQFIVGDIHTLKEYNLLADIIIFNDVLEHLEAPEQYLMQAREYTKYIGIRVPMEKTWLIAGLNKLKLKKPQSRLRYTEGHLHEFSKYDVYSIIERCGLRVVAHRITNDPKHIVYHPYVRDRMRGKKGLIGKCRYLLYCLMERMPFVLTRVTLKPLKGSTLVALCEV